MSVVSDSACSAMPTDWSETPDLTAVGLVQFRPILGNGDAKLRLLKIPRLLMARATVELS